MLKPVEHEIKCFIISGPLYSPSRIEVVTERVLNACILSFSIHGQKMCWLA